MFWDDDQTCYGHVLGFTGLERRVVVLALNEGEPKERAKERLCPAPVTVSSLSATRSTLSVWAAPIS